MNILQLQDNLKNFSEDQLVREMQMPSGQVPQFLVLSELGRRKRVKDDYQAQQAANQPTVAEEVVAAAGVPQGGIMDVARAMAPKSSIAQNDGYEAQPQQMASGGVVKMAKGDSIWSRIFGSDDEEDNSEADQIVEPFPADSPNPRDRGAWMAKYGDTHNKDGTPKSFGSFVDEVGGLGDVSEDMGDYGLPNARMQADDAIAAARGKDPQDVNMDTLPDLPQVMSEDRPPAPSAPDFSTGFDFDATAPTSPLDAMMEVQAGQAREGLPSYVDGGPRLRFSRGAGGFKDMRPEITSQFNNPEDQMFAMTSRSDYAIGTDPNYYLGPTLADQNTPPAPSIKNPDLDPESGEFFSEMSDAALSIIANMGGNRGDKAASEIAAREAAKPPLVSNETSQAEVDPFSGMFGADESGNQTTDESVLRNRIAEYEEKLKDPNLDDRQRKYYENGLAAAKGALNTIVQASEVPSILKQKVDEVAAGVRGTIDPIISGGLSYISPEMATDFAESSDAAVKYFETQAAENEKTRNERIAEARGDKPPVVEEDNTGIKGLQNFKVGDPNATPSELSFGTGEVDKPIFAPRSDLSFGKTVEDAKEKAEAKKKADDAAAAKSTTSTTGTGSGGSGKSGGVTGTIAEMMKDLEKSREQDKWLAIAQIGAELMKPTATVGEGVGNALSKGVDAIRGSRQSYQKDKLELMGLQQKIDAAKAKLSGTKAPKPKTASELNAYLDYLQGVADQYATYEEDNGMGGTVTKVDRSRVPKSISDAIRQAESAYGSMFGPSFDATQ